MRIATGYEINSHTGRIICPGEIIFDEINANKQKNISSEPICPKKDNIITDVNKDTNESTNTNESTENRQEDNIISKAKKSKKSTSSEIN